MQFLFAVGATLSVRKGNTALTYLYPARSWKTLGSTVLSKEWKICRISEKCTNIEWAYNQHTCSINAIVLSQCWIKFYLLLFSVKNKILFNLSIHIENLFFQRGTCHEVHSPGTISTQQRGGWEHSRDYLRARDAQPVGKGRFSMRVNNTMFTWSGWAFKLAIKPQISKF